MEKVLKVNSFDPENKGKYKRKNIEKNKEKRGTRLGINMSQACEGTL